MESNDVIPVHGLRVQTTTNREFTVSKIANVSDLEWIPAAARACAMHRWQPVQSAAHGLQVETALSRKPKTNRNCAQGCSSLNRSMVTVVFRFPAVRVATRLPPSRSIMMARSFFSRSVSRSHKTSALSGSMSSQNGENQLRIADF